MCELGVEDRELSVIIFWGLGESPPAATATYYVCIKMPAFLSVDVFFLFEKLSNNVRYKLVYILRQRY